MSKDSLLTGKKPVYIIGVIVVFIAAFTMLFVIRDYYDGIRTSSQECNLKCSANEICEMSCGLKHTASATARVILIFVFIMVILSVYFILVQSIPS